MMKYGIESWAEVAVLGKLGQGPARGSGAWISPLWQAANADFGQIASLVLRDEAGVPLRLWGAMRDAHGAFAPWQGSGQYLAGAQVALDADAPEGWTLWMQPAGDYLIAPCTQTNYGEVFQSVLKRYLPRRRLRLIGAVQERYDPRQGGGKLELCFPIASDR